MSAKRISKKMYGSCLILLCAIAGSMPAFSLDFATAMSKFDANQQKIQTFVGSGTMAIAIYSLSQSAPSKSTSSGITLYLKSPDLIKILMTGEGGGAMSQRGDFITQKLPGSNTLITSKVTNATDLFGKYFLKGISSKIAGIQIVATSAVTEQNRSLTKFTAKVPVMANPPASNVSIDTTDYFFDENDMLVRVVSSSRGLPIAQTDYTYEKNNGVFAATKVQTTVISGQSRIVTTISYTAVSLNTTVDDKEFELK